MGHDLQMKGFTIVQASGESDRAPKLGSERITEARERVSGGVPRVKVARDLGVSRQTLYAALKGFGSYAAITEARA